MKICVLLSGEPGSKSKPQTRSCPSRWAPTDYRHQFATHYINVGHDTTRGTAKDQLDALLGSGSYDLYWNLMDSESRETPSLLRRLEETKGVQVIGTSSKFGNMTQVEMKRKIKAFTSSTAGVMAAPTSPSRKPDHIVQDADREIAVCVLETAHGVIALPPLLVVKAAEAVSSLVKKDPALASSVSASAIRAFCTLGIRGSGYARFVFRVLGHADEDGTRTAQLVEVQTTPTFFDPNTADSNLIESSFQGGHPALIDTILKAKERHCEMVGFFDKFAPGYEKAVAKLHGLSRGHPIRTLLGKFPFRGSILDVGAGTGLVAKEILSYHEKQKHETDGRGRTPIFTAIEASPGMAALCRQQSDLYASVHVGRMENVLLELRESGHRFDQVLGSMIFTFVDPQSFPVVMDSLFALATGAVTLCVEEILDEYNQKCAEVRGEAHVPLFNHTDYLANVKLPDGWNCTYKEKIFLYSSPQAGMNVSGYSIRYERVVTDDNNNNNEEEPRPRLLSQQPINQSINS